MQWRWNYSGHICAGEKGICLPSLYTQQVFAIPRSISNLIKKIFVLSFLNRILAIRIGIILHAFRWGQVIF